MHSLPPPMRCYRGEYKDRAGGTTRSRSCAEYTGTTSRTAVASLSFVGHLGVAEAVLDVGNAPVRVARTDLEVSETRPSRWTIVARPRDAENVPDSWGELYAVCPNCAARAPMGRPSGQKRCTRCEQAFEVAWDERYLKDG